MSAWLSHRLTAKPVSLSPASCASQRPRSPLSPLPLVRTFARYVRSNSFHEPARSFPHVTRITMTDLLFIAAPRPAGSEPRDSLRRALHVVSTLGPRRLRRCIRSWIELDLVPEPVGHGPGA